LDKSDLLNQLRIERGAPAPARRAGWWLVPVLLAVGAYVTFEHYRPAGPAVRTVAPRTLALGAPDSAVLDATGYVTARRQATVSSKITGRVAEVLIEEGQTVTAGEVLARLEPTDAQAQVDLASAEVRAAEAQLADLEVQLAQARRDLRREHELADRQLTSRQSAEDAQSTVQSLSARIASQRAQIAVARRRVEVAHVALDNTVVRAPFAGVVTVKAAQPGEIVSPISAGGGFTRTGIGTIVDMDSLEIEVDVNEAYISRVRPDQAVEAVLNAYPEWKIPARVITIVPAADRSKATVKVRIALDLRDPRIVPDMGVRVSFLEEPASTAAALTGLVIPAEAIVTAGDVSTVYVLDDGRARVRPVTLGQRHGTQREILRGLDGSEAIISPPPPGLTDGQRVARAPAP